MTLFVTPPRGCRWLSVALIFVWGPLLLVWGPVPATAETSQSPPAFERDIRPILKAACFQCHGEAGEAKGDLDVRLVRFMAEGGYAGPAIVPGDREASFLYQRIRDGEMPPDEGHRLSGAEIELIGRWIDAGARTLRPEPESIDGPLITREEREHWSLRPIRRPDVPALGPEAETRNPIDRFVLARLREEGLGFVGEAPAAAARPPNVDRPVGIAAVGRDARIVGGG